MRWALALAVLALVGCQWSAAAPAKSKARHTATKAVSTQKSSPRSKASAGRGSAATTSRTRSRGGRRVARKPPAPSFQTHPDPERYRQIQQALTDKGYFKGEVNGQWNDDSIDALKRFQADQKMEPDGSINSLSLIGLGLGPKHDGSTVASSSPAPH